MRRVAPATALAIALVAATPALAFEANGLKLGASEADVRKAFPNAYCKPLEWQSNAADRRCDDARATFAAVRARLTVYLKAGEVQALDLRFDAPDLEALKQYLRRAYGQPSSEATEVIARGDKGERRVFKMRWEKGAERAVLSAPENSKRVGLEAWRGNFDTEIYRVK